MIILMYCQYKNILYKYSIMYCYINKNILTFKLIISKKLHIVAYVKINLLIECL